MTGSLSESHYDVVREDAKSDQSCLSDFSSQDNETTIAVVSKPGNLTDYTDEWMAELGMPKKYLKRYRQYLAGYKTNSAVEKPYERAWSDAQLEREYLKYVRSSNEAQEALAELVRRLEEGEDITLVCFEKPGQPCHRHLLVEMVEKRLSSKFFSDNKIAAGD